MSAGDDGWGVDGRTVIRPSPASRPAPSPDRTVIATGPTPAAAAGDRTLISSPQEARPQFDPAPAPAAAPSPILPSDNQLLAAATPVLMLIGRAQRLREPLEIGETATAIATFQQKVAALGIQGDDARIAAFALCEAADDIGRALARTDRQAWETRGMVATFFRSQARGSGFFDALNRLLADPASHLDLIELMHACLALGFEGQYRGRPDALESLRRVRGDVYATLRQLRQPPAEPIAPRWQEASAADRRRAQLIRSWGLAAAAPLIALLVFLALSYMVDGEGDRVAQRLLGLSPEGAVTLDRAALAAPAEAPPEPAQPAGPSRIERVRAALAEDLGSGAVTIAPRDGMVVLTINNALLFRPGGAELLPEFAPVARRLAAMLEREPGPATVVGHTDNVPPRRGGPFASNADLSVARARAVRDAVAAALSDPERLRIEGRGDAEPIADNATPEGRATNRRVDLILPVGDVP